jgi:peptide/nickel transport system substrate-binding protein
MGSRRLGTGGGGTVRQNMSRSRFQGLVGLTALLLISLCTGANSQADRELIMSLSSDIGSLDPINQRGASEHLVGDNVLSHLIRMLPGTSELVPDLAESWSISEDGLTYTFHLRPDAEFHHGYGPVTASDVKFSFERHMDPTQNSIFRADFELVESIETPDDHTVIIRLTAPNPGWSITALAYRPGWIVSQAAVEERGVDFGTAPVGSGPYAVTGYQRGQAITLEAHPGYHGDPPLIGHVTIRFIPEDTVAYAALRSGDIQLMLSREGQTYVQALADPTLEVHTTPSQSVRSVYFNTSRPPLDDPTVRRALAHAINREAIVVGALDRTGAVADAVISPGTWGYTSDIPTYDYDPERARELLADAGFGSGLRLEFVFPFQAPYDTFAEVVQAQLAEVGVTVDLVGLERVAWNDHVATGDYDITALGLTRPPDPDVYFTTGWHSANVPPGQNFSFYGAADALIERARSETDQDARLDLVHQILRQIAEDVPGVPIYYPFHIVVSHPDVQGITPGIVNDLWLASVYFNVQ